MRYFLLGLVAVLAGAWGTNFVFEQHRLYGARRDTSGMLGYLALITRDVSAEAVKQKSLTHLKHAFDPAELKSAGIAVIQMSEAGVLVVKGGRDGQMLVLTPSLAGDKVEWRCIGGPLQDVPIVCREGRTL